jgi:hypothetical protein
LHTQTFPAAVNSGAYPIQLTVTGERQLNRLWGIPYFGMLVRWILAIPHFVILILLGIVLYLWILVGWIPILINGRVPAGAVRLLTEYIRRSARVIGYTACLMPGPYPPLEMGSSGPVHVQFNFQSLEINRLWGIPFVGLFVRVLALIPHFIVLSLAGIVFALSLIVLWIPILISGTYPTWAVTFYGRFLSYATRVEAYALLLPVPYPPISFS